MKLPDSLDRRKKLTDEQKREIRERYHEGGVSMRGLAKDWGVSKRTIQFAVYPERYEAAKQRRRDAWADGKYRGYYTKEEHRLAIKSVRDRKKALLKG